MTFNTFEIEINDVLVEASKEIQSIFKHHCENSDRKINLTDDVYRGRIQSILEPIILSYDRDYEFYQIRWMSEEYCGYLCDMQKQYDYGETELRDVSELLEILLAEKYEREIKWIVHGMMNQQIMRPFRQYFQHYGPHRSEYTNWHIDGLSDVTLTLPLNDGYRGGDGIEISGRGFWEGNRALKYAGIGVANLFKGHTRLHRSLTVTEGNKNLLVMWSNQECTDK